MNKPTNLQQAIKSWVSALTADRVLQNTELIKDYNETTFQTTGGFKCILLPKTADEVSQCVKIANQYEIGIYSVSQGKNYGLGSKLSVANDSVLLDLSRMQKITDFSEKLAYITVEPGVTFTQVSEYLESRQSNLMMDSIGSTGNASIIGNTAERGHGVALNSDRFNYTCAMEVVLPTGEIINTGFGGLQQKKVAHLSKWGLGPSLDGLFTQSNLGIITRLSLWLQPKPKHFQILLFHIKDDANLAPVIERMREARLNKLSLSLRIFNDIRMLSFSQQYPWEAMNNETPLTHDVLADIKNKRQINGKWIGLGALYSINEDFAQAERKYIINLLEPYVNKIEFYDEERANEIKRGGSDEERDFIDFIFFKSSLRGFTSESPLNMCYWRVKKPIPEIKNLHDDNCGVLWYCPAIPNTDEDVQNAINIIENTSKKYKMEPNIGFLFISERALDITGAICYDKSDTEQDRLARKCHDEILDEFMKSGYPPYRLGIQSMHLISSYLTDNRNLLLTLKKALDPKNIMSNQRYIPNTNHY